MNINSSKVQWYLVFGTFLIISLFFVGPTFVSYVKETAWVEIEIRNKNKDQRPSKELIREVDPATRLFIQATDIAGVKPTQGYGWYFLTREIVEFVLLFIALWYYVKLMISLETHLRFEKETALCLKKLGWCLLIIGAFAIFHKYFLNFWVLSQIGLSSYKYAEIGGGGYAVVGMLLIYFSRFHEKGISLQTENELTI